MNDSFRNEQTEKLLNRDIVDMHKNMKEIEGKNMCSLTECMCKKGKS